MTRKIINVFIDAENLWALCDDGTLWMMRDGGTAWSQCPSIPQDAPMFWQWPPRGLKADLWHLVDGEPLKIIDRDTFWITLAASEPVVEAAYPTEAKRMLLDPSTAPERNTFTYEGQTFTIPSDPIPF